MEDTGNELFEQVTLCLADRLWQIYYENGEYKECIEAEEEQYERLKKGLSEEKQIQLDEYMMSTSKTVAVISRLAYQQGMKDLVSFYKTLSNNR